MNEALQTYRFHEAANRIYDFFWGEFCDWYLELIKPRCSMRCGRAQRSQPARIWSVLFEASLRLLHPVMPFITEEIWHAMYDGKPPLKSIALAAYPQANEKQIDLAAETEMAILQDLIVSIRNLRAELKVEPKGQGADRGLCRRNRNPCNLIEQNRSAVERLANVETISRSCRARWRNCRAPAALRASTCMLIYEKKIDVGAECERLKKELEKIEKEMANNQRQLSNEQFLAKAPAHVVEGLRKRAGRTCGVAGKDQKQAEGIGM